MPACVNNPQPLIQSAVNISEGRIADTVRALVQAARRCTGVTLADWSTDPDHNRMVATLLGPPESIQEGILALAQVAVQRIDLRQHSGAHPRLGALDVVPLTPLRDVSMAECVELSRSVARRLAEEHGLPVYLYENSASPGRHSDLPSIRRGQFEALAAAPLVGERAPDFGPSAAHPTAGAVVVGARGPLVAYNLNFPSQDLPAARRVAAWIREHRASISCLAGVRALALALPSRSLVQVSLNLTRPLQTPLPAVFCQISAVAGGWGLPEPTSEVIGLVPSASLGGEDPAAIRWLEFRPYRLVEYWLERL